MVASVTALLWTWLADARCGRAALLTVFLDFCAFLNCSNFTKCFSQEHICRERK